MDVKEERRKKDRERYARMTDEEKQEKLKKRREAYQQKKKQEEAKKQSMPSKDSIAIVNPTYIPTEEVGASNLNERQRKPVSPGERHTFLHRRNEEFSTKQRTTTSLSSQENTCVMNDGNYRRKQPQVLINGNTI
jgi:single-stranded DNA-specific DHH superfamily exonuclease